MATEPDEQPKPQGFTERLSGEAAVIYERAAGVLVGHRSASLYPMALLGAITACLVFPSPAAMLVGLICVVLLTAWLYATR